MKLAQFMISVLIIGSVSLPCAYASPRVTGEAPAELTSVSTYGGFPSPDDAPDCYDYNYEPPLYMITLCEPSDSPYRNGTAVYPNNPAPPGWDWVLTITCPTCGPGGGPKFGYILKPLGYVNPQEPLIPNTFRPLPTSGGGGPAVPGGEDDDNLGPPVPNRVDDYEYLPPVPNDN